MGYITLEHELNRETEISSHQIRLYSIMKSLNPCFPSYTYLSNVSGLSRPIVIASVKWLIEHGLIDKISKGNSFGNSNQYKILPKKYWKVKKLKIKSKVVKEIDQSSELTSTSKGDLLEVVNQIDCNNNNIKITNKNNNNVIFDFLDQDTQAWIRPVSDKLKSRWLQNYSESTLSREISKAYEWSLGQKRSIKSIGSFLSNWLHKLSPDNQIEAESEFEAQMLKLHGGNNEQ